MNKLKSRKFLVAIFGAISYFVLEYWGIKIPEEILYFLLGWIGVEGATDVAYAINGRKTVTPQAKKSAMPERKETPEREMNIPSISDAVAEFELIWKQRGNYILLNPDNPQQVEVDYLQPYAEALQASRRMWKALRGEEAPLGIDPCECGDKSYEARWLRFARSELAIQQSMVEAIKRNKPILNYQLGGLGYLLNGIKWELIPDWAKQNLEEHISKEVKK